MEIIGWKVLYINPSRLFCQGMYVAHFYPWSKVEPWVNRWTFSSPSPFPSSPPSSHHQIFVSLRYRKRRGGGGRMLCLQSCLSKNPDFLETRTLGTGFVAWRLALSATSVMLDRERIYSLSCRDQSWWRCNQPQLAATSITPGPAIQTNKQTNKTNKQTKQTNKQWEWEAQSAWDRPVTRFVSLWLM